MLLMTRKDASKSRCCYDLYNVTLLLLNNAQDTRNLDVTPRIRYREQAALPLDQSRHIQLEHIEEMDQ